MKNKITKKEMKKIFLEEGLSFLGFPVCATSGEEIIDWKYYYDDDYETSNLKIFKEVIRAKYPHRYNITVLHRGAKITLVN